MTKTIPLTQGKLALVDDADFEWLNQWKWHAVRFRDRYYAVRTATENETSSPTTVYMHRLIMGTDTGQATHHLNNDGLDNRQDNLRVCTPKEHKEYHYPHTIGPQMVIHLRLEEKLWQKLENLALLSRRKQTDVMRILIEDANLNDVTRILTQEKAPA